MWVSRKEWDELQEKVRKLENAQFCLRAPYPSNIGRVVDHIMNHLGIRIDRAMERDTVIKDG